MRPDLWSVFGLHSSVCARRYNLLSDQEHGGHVGLPRSDDPVPGEMERETRFPLNCHRLNTQQIEFVYEDELNIPDILSTQALNKRQILTVVGLDTSVCE